MCNYISKQMTKLTLNNGEEIYESKDIIKEVKVFYERLYSERQVEDCEILDMAQDIPILTLQEKTSLEGEITLAEAGLALKNMISYKSTGSDGFTAEFLSSFGCSWVLLLLDH